VPGATFAVSPARDQVSVATLAVSLALNQVPGATLAVNPARDQVPVATLAVSPALNQVSGATLAVSLALNLAGLIFLVMHCCVAYVRCSTVCTKWT